MRIEGCGLRVEIECGGFRVEEMKEEAEPVADAREESRFVLHLRQDLLGSGFGVQGLVL